MRDSTTQERMKWYEAGATFVGMWGTLVGGSAAVLLGYAIDFGFLNISPSKAFVIGAFTLWISMLCSMLVAIAISSAAAKEQ
ncbi:hypothetical protein [Janthinobacterium violaceinigrum]|uniref:Uncharacterized protein n=1 Tax=Janthinobacterium violaceinigrum TaxID=2654252 RepID=A0A6I1I689_9BURK|nr:hypothetical protein [Janthinobacterium violaceinigrum]KAB8065520.1 hypothetical protein GCN75_06975 [Janthinobacterium violaceinigrum]